MACQLQTKCAKIICLYMQYDLMFTATIIENLQIEIFVICLLLFSW